MYHILDILSILLLLCEITKKNKIYFRMIITIIEKKTKNVKGLEGNFMENHRKMSNKGDFYKNSMNLFPYFPFKIKKSALYKRSFRL